MGFIMDYKPTYIWGAPSCMNASQVSCLISRFLGAWIQPYPAFLQLISDITEFIAMVSSSSQVVIAISQGNHG